MTNRPHEMELNDRQWFNFICGMNAGLCMKNKNTPFAEVKPTETIGEPISSPDLQRLTDKSYPHELINIGNSFCDNLWVYRDKLTMPIYVFIAGGKSAYGVSDKTWGSRVFNGLFSGSWVGDAGIPEPDDPFDPENPKVNYPGMPDPPGYDPSKPIKTLDEYYAEPCTVQQSGWTAMFFLNKEAPTNADHVDAYRRYKRVIDDIYNGLPSFISAHGDKSEWIQSVAQMYTPSFNAFPYYSQDLYFSILNNNPMNKGIATVIGDGSTATYTILIYCPEAVECSNIGLTLPVGKNWQATNIMNSGTAKKSYVMPYKVGGMVVSVGEAGGDESLLQIDVPISGVLSQGWHQVCQVSETVREVVTVSGSGQGLIHNLRAIRGDIEGLQIDGVEYGVDKYYNKKKVLLNAIAGPPSLFIKYENGAYINQHVRPDGVEVPGHYEKIVNYTYPSSSASPPCVYDQWGYWSQQDTYYTDMSGNIVDPFSVSKFIGGLVNIRAASKRSVKDYSDKIIDVGGQSVWIDDSTTERDEVIRDNGYVEYTGNVKAGSGGGEAYFGLYDKDGKQVAPAVKVELQPGDNNVNVKVPLYNTEQDLNDEYSVQVFYAAETQQAMEQKEPVQVESGTAVSQSSASAPRIISDPKAEDKLIFKDSLTIDVITVQGDVEEDVEEDLIFEDSTDVDVHKSFDGNVDVTDTFGINDEENDETTSS